MKLHRHDEMVEAMAQALINNDAKTATVRATAALDALLDAAVRLEVAVTAKDGYPRMVFRMEASDDKSQEPTT